MKKRFSLKAITHFFICGLVVSIASCSKLDEQVCEMPSAENSKNHTISVEQAKLNALNFVNMTSLMTRSNNSMVTISDVKAFALNSSKTRSGDYIETNDTLFYIVSLNDNNGFVIAASDNRDIPVYAYVEEGAYEEMDTLNNGYQAFIASLIEHKSKGKDYKQEVDDGYDKPCIGGGGGGGGETPQLYDRFEVMYPLLKTKWDQLTFSSYCPGPYTGCVVTAISQICSFLKSPNHVSWSYNGIGNQCYIDWDAINNEVIANDGYIYDPILKDQISNLMRFWGVAFNADYHERNTGVDSDYAMSKMREYGFNATDLVDYDAANVINCLKSGNKIIYMRGNARYYHVGFFFRQYVDGHAWVVDGYIDSIKDNKESYYLHCNWGWGDDKNGYFLSDVFNAEEYPYYDDDANPITRSSNYQYNLETSTISK